ncbi:hypothetical protein BDQ17DRAFT_1391771 [Cyathus striatus]|nr:hypothetical protein BDQ17DRAFT_1391771 [Cyathus striatus]
MQILIFHTWNATHQYPKVQALNSITLSLIICIPIHQKEEEEEDKNTNANQCYIEEFPPQFKAGAPKQHCTLKFQQFCDEQVEEERAPWHLFENDMEWELACWLMTSGISQKKLSDFLKLQAVSSSFNMLWIKPSFHNAQSLLARIDNLPHGPGWTSTTFKIQGDELDDDGMKMEENITLWSRNPVECIKELIENPTFKDNLDPECKNREYGDMWTADWWWNTQARGSKTLPEGATIIQFSGDKEAWPVYLSIGNIEKSIPMVLIGYIPVSKLKCFKKSQCSAQGHQLFHECMKKLLELLVEAGWNGVDMACADGFIQTVYPILAAYIADYPEQCLIVCCQEIHVHNCGDAYSGYVLWQDPASTLEALQNKASGIDSEAFIDQCLDLLIILGKITCCDIFSCITPDILHQLHKGIFKDHIVNWAIQSMGDSQSENAMTTHPTLRHFKKGISLTSQWMGTEHKNMEKVFLGVVSGVTDQRVQLTTLHKNKEIFIDLQIWEHFNISKLHNIKHYCDSICSQGTADGFNTEGTEQLHIDLAKMGYNGKMVTSQESIHHFGVYLQWAAPGYVMELQNADDNDMSKS